PYVLKVIGWSLPLAAAVATAIWTVVVFVSEAIQNGEKARDDRQKQISAQLLEAQKPFLQKQLELYFYTLEVVGRLVTMPSDSEEWKINNMRFWQLYWTELAMVETEEVEQAMRNFGHQLKRIDFGGSNSPSGAAGRPIDSCAYELSRAIKQSIQK